MKKLLLTLLLLPTLSNAESYLCIAEASGGVKYNKSTGKWRGVEFIADSKYVVKKENNKWIVNEFGKDFDLTYGQGCNGSELNDADATWDRLFCQTVGGQMQVDVKNLRYVKSYIVGYQDEDLLKLNLPIKLSIDTPLVEVGDCSKI